MQESHRELRVADEHRTRRATAHRRRPGGETFQRPAQFEVQGVQSFLQAFHQELRHPGFARLDPFDVIGRARHSIETRQTHRQVRRHRTG